MKNILTESEKNEILEMHRKHGYKNFLNEGQSVENVNLGDMQFNVTSQVDPGMPENDILYTESASGEDNRVILNVKPSRFDAYEMIIVKVGGGLVIEEAKILNDPSERINIERIPNGFELIFNMSYELMEKMTNNRLDIQVMGNLENIKGIITLNFKGSTVKG
jgi:hypothetical protein